MDQLNEMLGQEDAVRAAGPAICVPCLIARVVILALATAAIIALIILQRRQAIGAAETITAHD